MDRQTLRDWVHRYNDGAGGVLQPAAPQRPATTAVGQAGGSGGGMDRTGEGWKIKVAHNDAWYGFRVVPTVRHSRCGPLPVRADQT